MDKKILIAAGVLALCIFLAFALLKITGKPLAGACETDADCRLVRCAGAYCDNGKCLCPQGESDFPKVSVGNLSKVKVGIVYERLSDARPKRTIEEQIRIFEETNTDLVFRATWRWKPMPHSCDDVPSYQKTICEESGYSFEQLRDMIREMKKKIPDIIVVGAVPAQRINKEMEVNDKTGETLSSAQVWDMAVDPAKWGISSPTKQEFQEMVGTSSFSGPGGYYPDITNPDFQELLMGWAENQVDAGMDAIWIDLLYTQAGLLAKLTGDVNHPAVRESYESATKIVDAIHAYGDSKGRQVYVGTWSASMNYPYTLPELDFITVTPTSKEVFNGGLGETKWKNELTKINSMFNNVPIFAFIDWAGDGAPISVFSQGLSSVEQSEFLRTADEFFTSQGVVFMHPVHGGSPGPGSTTLAYGEYGWYDSLAPEFRTYETIKELAQNKK